MHPSASTAGGSRKTLLTREHVITKIQRWNALFGEPPSTADWNPSLARWRAQEWRIERYRQGDPETGEPWPSLNAAKRLFDGSFDAAVREAGLVPHRPGPRRRAAGAALPKVEQREPMAPRDVDAELLAASERVLEAERRAQRAEARVQRAVDRAERAEAKIADARERVRTVERRAVERARGSTIATQHRRPATDERAVRAAQARAARAEQTARDAEAHAAELSRALEAAEERVARVEAARAAEVAVAALAHETSTGNGNGNGNGHTGPGPANGNGHAVARLASAHGRVAGGRGTLVEHRARAAEQRAIAAASAAEATRACEVISARRARSERDAAVARAEAAERRVRELERGRPLAPAELDELREGGTGPVGPGPLTEAIKGLAAARASKDRTRIHDALTQVARAAVRWRERL